MNMFEVSNLIEDRTDYKATVSSAGDVKHVNVWSESSSLKLRATIRLRDEGGETLLRVEVYPHKVTDYMPIDEALIYLRLRLSV